MALITMAASGFAEASGYPISTLCTIGADAGLATVLLGGLVVIAVHCWNTGNVGWIEGSSMVQCWDAAKNRLANIAKLVRLRKKRVSMSKEEADDPG